MNSSSHSPSCSQFASGLASGASVSEWRPNFLTIELFVALISVTIVNLLVTPSAIFLNVLVILAVKATPQLRNKYNVLLACLAGTDVMTGALGQPLFIIELIYRLTGSPASEFCIISHTARSLSRAFALISLQHLALISIERYISIKFPFKYDNIVTKRRLIVNVVFVWLLVFLTILFFRYKIFFLGYFLLGLAIVMASFILIFCRIASYHEARKQLRNITTQSAKAKLLNQKKALRTTSCVIGLVLLFCLPMILFRLVFVLLISSPETFLAIESFTLTILLCNSVVNPVIYCARSRQYRRAFKKLLHIANNVRPA